MGLCPAITLSIVLSPAMAVMAPGEGQGREDKEGKGAQQTCSICANVGERKRELRWVVKR